MSDEIVNRVANSNLVQFDLEDFYPQGKRCAFDLTPFLWQGMAVKEKDFRQALKSFDWNEYQDCYVAIPAIKDAIIPTWAYMLVSAYLNEVAKLVVIGDLDVLENAIYQPIIESLNPEDYQNKPVIVKGCGKYQIPPHVYVQVTNKLQTVAKSVMFGEACSSVPVFKQKK